MARVAEVWEEVAVEATAVDSEEVSVVVAEVAVEEEAAVDLEAVKAVV